MIMYWAVPKTTKESQVKKMTEKIGFEIIDQRPQGDFVNYKLKEKGKNKVGQPQKDITKEEILALRKKGNSMYVIAKMLGVSRKTLYNRIGEKPKKKISSLK